MDAVDPNINIEIGNVVGVTADWAVGLIGGPTGTAYIDLPKDGNGNYIFPDANVTDAANQQEYVDLD